MTDTLMIRLIAPAGTGKNRISFECLGIKLSGSRPIPAGQETKK